MRLNLINVKAPRERSLFWRLLSPFEGELKLREGSREEVLGRAADPNALIRRYGLPRVLSFYEEQLLPALNRLPDDWAVWRAGYEVAYQIVQMRTYSGAPGRVIELARAMLNGLGGARFNKRLEEDGEVRRQVQAALIPLVAQAADQLRSHESVADAIIAYETLERLGGLDSAHLAAYAERLWAEEAPHSEEERHPPTVRLYLRYLIDRGWEVHGEPQVQKMAEYVKRQLAIDEQTPHEELAQRILLNQLALCSSDHTSPAARHIGVGYLRLNQPGRALEYLRRACVTENATDSEAAFYFGQALYQTGDMQEADKVFAHAAEQGFSRSQVASWRALALVKQGDWEKALQIFRTAEAESGEALDSEFYLHWGRASFLMKNTSEAEQLFRRALQQDADDWRAAQGLAICLDQLGKRPEAIAMLQQTEEQLKNEGGTRNIAAPIYLLGRLLQKEGRMVEARARYRRAVSFSSQEPQYLLSLGLALDPDDMEGLQYLERAATARAGGPEVIRRLMLGYQQKGAVGRARYWLRKLEEDHHFSEGVAAYYARDLASQATEAFNTGRYGESIELWKQVTETMPEEPRISEHLALANLSEAAARLKNGQVEGVWMHVEQARHLAADAQFRFLSGIARLVQGDFVDSRQDFSSLLAQHPDHSGYRYFTDLTSLLAVEDKSLADCVRVRDNKNDPLQPVLAGMQAALFEVVNPFLTPLASARMEDDLPWPPPPSPFEPEYEAFEVTILRDQ